MDALSSPAAFAIFEAICSPLVLLDDDDAVLTCNAAAEALWPGLRGRMGLAFLELFGEGDNPILMAKALARAHDGHASRSRVCFSEADRRWLDVDLAPLLPDPTVGAATLMLAWDVTEHVERTQCLEADVVMRSSALATVAGQLLQESHRLVAARRQISHSEKVKLFGQFVGRIVHDMNNVLAVTRAVFNLARRRAGDSLPADLFDDGQCAIDRGIDLVRQLLSFARGNEDGPETIDVAALFAENGQLFQHLVGDAATVELDALPETWPLLLRPGTLQSVLFNLVANARDAVAGRDGGCIRICARNRPAEEHPEALMARDYVHLFVADDGSGMPPEVLAQVGQPFFTTKAKGKGTGLGLASAFDLAGAVGGAVLIDSAPGVGTTVNLWLPRAGAYDVGAGAVADPVDRSLHGGATILVAETDEGVRTTLSDFLRTLHYTVLEAASAETVLVHRLAPIPVDLLVISADLAERPGENLARDFREAEPGLPVIVLEAGEPRPSVEGAVALRKPVYEPMLAQVVLERLGRLPARVLTPGRLSGAERLRGRLRDPAMRDAFEHWFKVSCAYRRLPSLDDLPELTHRFRDYGYLVAVDIIDGEPIAFRIERFGQDLSARLGRDLTGAIIGSDTEPDAGWIRQAWRRCATGVPFYDYARFRLVDRTTRFDRLLLPLSEDGEGVTHLFGAVRFDDGSPPPEGGQP